MAMQTVPVLETVIREVQAGRRSALCVVVATRGSTPQGPGAMMCVDEAGNVVGTIGGGCGEAEIRRRAFEMVSAAPTEIANNVPRSQSPRLPEDCTLTDGTVITLTLDHDFGFDDGLICGGHMDMAVCVCSRSEHADALRHALGELDGGRPATIALTVVTADGRVEYRLNLEPTPKLVIAGGGHIGRHLAEMMPRFGFDVSVIDDRPEFANAERFPAPVHPVVGDIAETLARWPIDANTYIVIVTRGHKYDEAALRAVIDSPARYLGMIGSRRKIKVIYEDLMHDGIPKEKVYRVYAPIGIAINCVTPEEIALSIAAQLVSTRRERHASIVEGPFPLQADAPIQPSQPTCSSGQTTTEIC